MFTIGSRRRGRPPHRLAVTVSRTLSRRLLRTLVLVGVAAAAMTATAAPALAAESCGKQVVNDWYGDGRVDKIYPLHCYEDAINALPTDLSDYSSAKEDIQRALQLALRHKPDTGPRTPTTTDTTPTTTDTTPTPTDTGGPLNEAVDSLGPSNADSVPIPLLVLGGLALLLLAAGSAGYLRRRLRGRRGGPPAA